MRAQEVNSDGVLGVFGSTLVRGNLAEAADGVLGGCVRSHVSRGVLDLLAATVDDATSRLHVLHLVLDTVESANYVDV